MKRQKGHTRVHRTYTMSAKGNKKGQGGEGGEKLPPSKEPNQ